MRYMNPWFRSGKPEYGPAFYETSESPIEYRGVLIVERVPNVWDVVVDDVCVTQRAGPDGAKRFVDQEIFARTST